MSDSTFHTTREDLRKAESKVSQKNDGNVPSDSEPSQLKSIIDQNSKPKQEIIDERQANLPLPDQPPVASDWNSSDSSKVNVGSGGVQSDVSYGAGSESGLRGPATSDSSVRTDGDEYNKLSSEPSSGVGRQGHDGLDGLPEDATKR
ncbi:hypothetical protein P7C71_g3828, partial [Lecanoromycetidae sp. Uapishka_2]